ncbi:uncharacterized protein LOC133890752 [Phragmites australis]|uniref:uncharacterized protein LOC133890752 n=1 Tax=Phragmites australis TaxID=29695 RepID=UPI002D79271F|nr:uncharacterized protein LOC133890752 [Phragmites australis]
MKTKAAGNKATVDEDEAKPKKIRSSHGKRRRGRHSRSRSSSGSESPPRKRSKKHSRRIPGKMSKRSKVGSSSLRRHRRRRRSLSPDSSLSSSSPSSVSRSYSRRGSETCHSSSSASDRSVSPPRSRSRDVRKRKGRGRDRDREKDRKRRKVRRSRSYTSSAASSGRSRSRSKSKSRKQMVDGARDDATRDKLRQDYNNQRTSQAEENMIEDVDGDDKAVAIAEKRDGHIDRYEKNVSLEKMEKSPPSKDANEIEDILPAGRGSPVAEDLELILRQKALENFRKFRQAAIMAEKRDDNAAGKEALADRPQNTGTKIAEARSAAVTPFQRQGSSLGVGHSAGSPRSEDCGNGTSHSWKHESNAGMSCGAGSPGILEAGDTGGPTQQKGSMLEATHSTSQLISPQYSRNSHSVMRRLVSIPGSSGSVRQRLGSSAGVSHVSGTPSVRSVVSIPAREGLDGSTYTTPRPGENSAPVEGSSEVGHPLIDINKAEGTNGDERKTSEASATNDSIVSPAEDKIQARIDDKDGSQFQKKTFSRMHEGEMVEVSYKVYIPKKTPALARRKLQR